MLFDTDRIGQIIMNRHTLLAKEARRYDELVKKVFKLPQVTGTHYDAESGIFSVFYTKEAPRYCTVVNLKETSDTEVLDMVNKELENESARSS